MAMMMRIRCTSQQDSDNPVCNSPCGYRGWRTTTARCSSSWPPSQERWQSKTTSVNAIANARRTNLDLVVLESNQGVLCITVAVVLGQERNCGFVATVVDVPSRRLGDGVDQEELDKRRETLEQTRNPPGPVVRNAEGSECRPGGNDGTEVPR